MSWKRKEYIWYQSSHILNNLLTHLILNPTILGKSNIPRKGRVIVAPTHRSMVDIPCAGCITWQPMRWMVKIGLVSNKFSKYYFETCGSFGVDNNSNDPTAIKKAIAALEGDDKLLIFPEGMRNKYENIGELSNGVGFVAAKTNSPIVPVAIYGAEKPFYFKNFIPRRSKIYILIGEPMTDHIDKPGKTSQLSKEITKDLAKNLYDLFEQCKEF
jgi:1-acyl-sn-glycerol-3-phosphate acyltransferase